MTQMKTNGVTTNSGHAVTAEQKAVWRKQLFSDIENMVPRLRQRTAEALKLRRVPDETVSELKQCGFFRMLQPGDYQGMELDPQDFCRLITTLATGCMSTAWICGVIGVHPFQLALFDHRAQQEVWSDDVDTLMSSSYAPMGKAEPVEGGFRFSGRWGWSSGCDHCQWVLVGGLIPNEGYRTFLVPRSDYRIEDTWHVMGLQGTGSNDIVIKDAFVPDYRTHGQMDGFLGTNPGGSIYQTSLYRIPWGQIFVRAVATAQIGGLKRALELFIASVGTGKSSGDLTKQGSDPAVQTLVANTANTIDEIEAVLYRNFETMMECVDNDRPIPLDLRIRSRYQASLVCSKTLTAINELFSFAGGRSVFLGNEIQQILLDIRISRAHVANNPTPFGRNLGATMLGAENTDFFL